MPPGASRSSQWPDDRRGCTSTQLNNERRRGCTPKAVLVRTGGGFATPVCAEHIEAGQAAIRGRTNVVPLEEWLAGPRGYRPGLAGS